MKKDEFQRLVRKSFPTEQPDHRRLHEDVRTESGHEDLEILLRVNWLDFSFETADKISGNFYQLSNVWLRYYLPAFMCLSCDFSIEYKRYEVPSGTIIEIDDEQCCFFDCLFSYWCSIEHFMSEQFDVTKNLFYRLTSSQINLIETWLQNIDFQILDEAYVLPSGFDYSQNEMEAFINKMKRL